VDEQAGVAIMEFIATKPLAAYPGGPLELVRAGTAGGEVAGIAAVSGVRRLQDGHPSAYLAIAGTLRAWAARQASGSRRTFWPGFFDCQRRRYLGNAARFRARRTPDFPIT
jgi:hypothetical protein